MQRTRSRFYLGMTLVLAAIVLTGFMPTLFGRALFNVPKMPGHLYLHGIVLAGWFALQTQWGRDRVLDVAIKRLATAVDGVLTIEGERTREKEEKGKKFHKTERSYGKFVRQFALPKEVDAVQVQAEYKDGVLNVHLPKTAAAKPKAIEVKVA